MLAKLTIFLLSEPLPCQHSVFEARPLFLFGSCYPFVGRCLHALLRWPFIKHHTPIHLLTDSPLQRLFSCLIGAIGLCFPNLFRIFPLNK
jgi:hypothetical protein